MRVTVDVNADTAYIYLSEEPVLETRELNESVYVDLDTFMLVRGIELLDLNVKLPVEELARAFHVDSRVLEALQGFDLSTIAVRQFQGRDSTISRQSKVPTFS